MASKKAPQPVITKTGVTLETNYCRKCMTALPVANFYECVDAGLVDANGLMSVCKDCTQDLYDYFLDKTGTMEKAIHSVCIALNIRYSNEAVSATRSHISTLLENGKQVKAVFSIYKMKLTATKKSMSKDSFEEMTYEDVGTIYVSDSINTKELPIPQSVVNFWGKNWSRDDLEYLETQYASFRANHATESHPEIVLLKEVCYTMLHIQTLRSSVPPGDTKDAIKELLELMKNLAISPKESNTKTAGFGEQAFGLWIEDIERYEPAQWLLSDPRGDIYRDVGNTDWYFTNYTTRPLKNFILQSKDFNIDKEETDDDDEVLNGNESLDFKDIDDGEVDDG